MLRVVVKAEGSHERVMSCGCDDPHDCMSLILLCCLAASQPPPSVTAGGNPYIAGGQRDLEIGHESVLNPGRSAAAARPRVYIDVCEGQNACK